MYNFNTNDYLVRIPLFIIFFWFGFLKIINLSPAQQLVMDTVYWMPFLDAATWTIIIGTVSYTHLTLPTKRIV